MKKLFPLLLFVLMAMAGCGDKKETAGDSSTTDQRNAALANSVSITLNGIDSLTADTMIKHFQKYRGQDNKPIQKSFWFEKATIVKIVALLDKEIQAQRKIDATRQDTTDGIRIYFGSDIKIKKGQLNNSILLVSTQNNGVDSSVPSKAFHKDYYSHDKSDGLFLDLNLIKGIETTRDIVNSRGEDLYDRCIANCDPPTTTPNLPHYITRGKANAMVNAFGNDVITTNSEWFDLNLLRAFAKDTTLNGIRIYFTRHPESYLGSEDKDYPLQAFVMVTTKKSGNLNRDYFDINTAKSYFTQYVKRLLPDPPPVGGQDNGEICPTHCD